MMADPYQHLHKIASFVGTPLDIEKMRAVPNGQLYRNRAPRSF
jgi:hypothetical protein